MATVSLPSCAGHARSDAASDAETPSRDSRQAQWRGTDATEGVNRTSDTSVLGTPWARPGQPLLVRVSPTQDEISSGTISVSLVTTPSTTPTPSASEARPARLFWIGQDSANPTATDPGTRWLVGSGATSLMQPWRAVPARLAKPGDGGFWLASIDIPTGPRTGAALVLSLGSSRIAVMFVDDATPGTTSRQQAVLSPRSRALSVSDVTTQALRRSPFTRWQARLAADEPMCAPAASAPDSFSDPIIESLAAQIESRAQWAVNRLARLDDDLAASVRRRMSGILEFESARATLAPRTLPFPAAPRATSSLMAQLSDMSLSNAAVLDSARAWLIEQTVQGAWIIDDAAAADAAEPGGQIALIGTLSTAPDPSLLALRADAARVPEATTLQPFSAAAITIAISPPSDVAESSDDTGEMIRSSSVLEVPRTPGQSKAPDPVVRTEVRIGSWKGMRRVVSGAVPITPPGLDIGPFSPDWTAPTLLTAASEATDAPRSPAVEPNWATTGRILREVDSLGGNGGGGVAGWTLYLECLHGPAAISEHAKSDRVVLHFGPSSKPTLALTVYSDGRVFRGLDPQVHAQTEPIDHIRTLAASDRWTAYMPLPPEVFERVIKPNGQSSTGVKIGIERIDSRGVRTAWPRPMLPAPLQTQPGRAILDLSSWGDVNTPASK